MPVKKSTRSKTLTRLFKSPRVKKYTRLMRNSGAGTTGAVVIGMMAAAMLIGAGQFQPKGSAANDTLHTSTSQVAAEKASAMMTPVAYTPVVESSPKASARKSTPVTITGCLQRDGETFQLKDTAGADAPKSRSWKSGFLKKGPASVEVVDGANRLRLRDHVGHRVSVTGTLEDREMQVRSVRRLGASCTAGARVKL